MKKFKHIAIALGFLFVYVGGYLILSVSGRFEPEAIGLNGVKWYAWAPQGFVHNFRWSKPLKLVFTPLWIADTRLWHTSGKAESGRYPVDRVDQKNIGKVYQAWKH